MPANVPPDQGGQANLFDALARLNRIGSAINALPAVDAATMAETLQLIVESATRVVAGASALLYVYDTVSGFFDPASRVCAGELAVPASGDEPRPNGMGRRAAQQRRRVLSYEEPDIGVHDIKVAAGAQTGGSFPLIVAGQVVGVLYVYLLEQRPFSELEMLMLENFTNQAATIVYHMRQLAALQLDLARREDELARLRRAGLLISSRLRLEETLEAILEMALEVTGAHYGIFRLVDKSAPMLVTRAIAAVGLGQPASEPLPIDGTSIMSWVAVHRQPLVIPDLQAQPWSGIYYPLDRGQPMRSELAVPLIGAGSRLEGVLNLESPLPGQFGERDSHLLQSLATQAVIAIQQARLLDALQEIAERLLLQPYQEVLDRIVDLAGDLLNTRWSTIWTREGDELVLAAGLPRNPGGPRRRERLPLQDSLVGRALLRGATLAAVEAPPDFKQGSDAPGVLLIVPLLASAGGPPVGAFSVHRPDPLPDQFADSEWDKKILLILSHYAALALENATRQEALRVSQEQRSVAETFAAMGDIAANLLHHLNNKVGTIPVRVEGIQDKCGPVLQANPYLAANLAQIQQSAIEAMAAVRESLSILRPLEKGLVSVAPCVGEAVAAAHVPPGVSVRTVGLDELPPVLAGAESVGLVIVNLLQNAADAMAGSGIVTISGTTGQGYVELRVSDTGPGIPAELHESIFEFSFSGRKATQKLGFGLWWVKTLVARLGGAAGVESDGQHGAVFWVKLPSARPEGGVPVQA